jgi:hypothetical protein
VSREGTIYNYFEDNDALLMAILHRLNETERRAEDFGEGMAKAFRGLLKEYLRRRMSLIWESRKVFQVVRSEMLVEGSRSDEVPDVLAGLLIHGLDATKGDRHE